MQEVKSPKRPMIYYYAIALLVVLVFNAIAMPYIDQAQIKQVDYNTFMDMTADNEISKVEVQENQILFKDGDGNTYRTGIMDDPKLIDRLHESGVSFTQDIKEKDSPILTFIAAWILPILIFFAIGQFLSRPI